MDSGPEPLQWNFCSYFDKKTDSIREYLLGCNVGEDVDEETEFVDGLDDSDKSFGFTADDWFDVIIDVLWKYEIKHNDVPINADNFNKIIEFITMDNCSTNRALARKSVGCASHRLHLAVEELEGKKETRNKQGRLTQAADGYRPVTRKLDLLMGELGTLKNSSLVRSKPNEEMLLAGTPCLKFWSNIRSLRIYFPKYKISLLQFFL